MRSAPPYRIAPAQVRMRIWVAGGYLRAGCGSAPNSGLRETSGRRRVHSLRQTLSTTQFSEPWQQWRRHRLNFSSLAGTFSACCCRCSGTPCRRWRTPCRGPGGTCWESAAEPPTKATAPSPRPCHQVLLCIPPSMGANAAQE